jgi:hypothetical protein
VPGESTTPFNGFESMDESLESLEKLFGSARLRAGAYAEKYNSHLPGASCPKCHDLGHVPGLRCHMCGYRHPTSWAIIRDTEWGYEVVALTNRKKVIEKFNVEDV